MALNLNTLGLSATVTAQGITAPDYQTILSQLTEYFRQIYGSDAYLEPDSKDGQMIALIALAIHDANNTAITVYNCFSPVTAYGAALSNNVKINGLTRRAETKSTVDLLLTGVPGTTISNGLVRDQNNVVWNLPASVTIDVNGTVTVTAICADSGAVAALTDTITLIGSPTRGWHTVTNPAPATVGTPAETDAELRIRQSKSVSIPAITPFDALDGALAAIPGVIRHKLYENDSHLPDNNGLPPHSISAVVDGGDAEEIARTIRNKKAPGIPTYGKIAINLQNPHGTVNEIHFSRPVIIPVYIAVELRALPGYTSPVGDEVKTAIADYINELDIGEDLLLSRLYSPANLTSGMDNNSSRYYEVLSIQAGLDPTSLDTANVPVQYDSLVSCITDNIIIRVTS